jgi:hypothetical protein
MDENRIVTKRSIEAAYTLLRGMKPFCDWKLPVKIEAQVSTDIYMFGCFEDPNTITISSGRVWTAQSLLETTAHEMIHLYQYRQKRLTDTPHDAFFLACAKEVCEKLGVINREDF